MTIINGTDYLDDPSNPGWVLGWGVFRDDTLAFVGLERTRGDAFTKAAELGGAHKAAYMSHRPATDEFIVISGMQTCDWCGRTFTSADQMPCSAAIAQPGGAAQLRAFHAALSIDEPDHPCRTEIAARIPV